jgi:hypothetical protein
MATWEDVGSSESSHHFIAFDSGTLILPMSAYAYACIKGERYVSLKADTESHRLGLDFAVHPHGPSALLLNPIEEDAVWGAKAFAADVGFVVERFDWIGQVAKAPNPDLRKVPLAYSQVDRMWISHFPCVFQNKPADRFGPSVTSNSRGVLRVWHDNRVVAVSNCLLRGYTNDPEFERSPWTAFDYAIVNDPLIRSFSAKWWRRHTELMQGQPLQYPSLSSWPGGCRSPEEILADKGWSGEAMQALVREMYDEQVGPGETILPDHLVEEWDESQTLDAQALFAQLTPAEKVEAYKYYAIENGDYDEYEDDDDGNAGESNSSEQSVIEED